MCFADKPWLIRELLGFPFLSSPPTVVQAALSLISLTEGEVFADLGCGEGNVLIQAAAKFRSFCVGFEIDQRLLPEAKSRIKQAGLSSLVDVVYADLFHVELSKFRAIYVYPFPAIEQCLTEKILAECRVGTQVVVHDYPLSKLQPAQVLDVFGNEMHQHKVYLYKL